MADSSLKIKALAATAVAVLVTIAVEQEEASSLLVALVLLIGFATLDAYYLSLERGFRDASEDLVLSVARGNVNWVSMFNVERAAGSSGLRAVASAFASPATAVFYMVIGLLLVLGSLLV
ncbi:MAG: hypothetical protein MSC31_18985 [Solirubrobacteraceae bacterium MAG38_C4-C5]|nr:hypothetical protein [Candidatus Siliceabacter maunaloa]